MEAEEDSDIDDDDDIEDETERALRTQQHESQYYTAGQLQKKTQGISGTFLANMEERYKDTVQDDEEFDEDEEDMD